MKKGISLIVLVITIIVMIILAAAVVITLSNTGIINKATEAVDKNNLNEVRQLATLAWTDAYLSGAKTVEELKSAIDLALDNSKIDKSKYDIIVTENGVTVTEATKAKLNEYGFYYDQPYVGTVEGNPLGITKVAFVFHKDGSSEGYGGNDVTGTDLFAMAAYEAGTMKYSKSAIVLNETDGSALTVSEDGKIMTGTFEGFAFSVTCTFEEVRGAYIGKKYTAELSDGSEVAMDIVNNVLSLYTDGVLEEALNIELVADNHMALYNGSQVAGFSINGKKVMVQETILTLDETNSPETPVDLSTAVITPVAGSSVEKIKAGNPSKGDTVEFNGYIYKYNQYFEGSKWEDIDSKEFTEGWGVIVADRTKTSYPNMLGEIYNVPVTTAMYTYANCTNLITAPSLPSSITNTTATFMFCSSLKTWSNFVDSEIGAMMFAYCSSLDQDLIIPADIKKIGLVAFFDCKHKNVYYQGTLEQWCNMELDGQGSNGLYDGATLNINGEKITNLVIPSTVTKIKPYTFEYCDQITSVTIPNTVKEIDCCAFRDLNITSITLPNSLEKIGEYAFADTNITSITIPSSVKYIDDFAFQDAKLTSFTLPKTVTKIGYLIVDNPELKTFYYTGTITDWLNMEVVWNADLGWPILFDSSNKFDFYMNGTKLTNVVIPEGVTKISTSRFQGIKTIISVTIPTSVKQIDAYAFDDCNNLTTINYAGSKAEWNAITFGEEWDGYREYSYTINYAK